MKRIIALPLFLLVTLLFAQQPAPVQIPDYSVNIKDFGAVADGLTLNTAAFEKAVAQLAKNGGGSLQMIHDITVKDAVFRVWDKTTQIDIPQMIMLENVRFVE